MTKKRFRFFITMVLALILVIIVGYDYYDRPNATKSLRYGMLKLHKNFDIFYTREEEALSIYRHVVEPLFDLNVDQELEPLLLESMPKHSDDYRSYHFKLKPNIYFHNGLPLKSEDVYFLFLRMFLATNPSFYHTLYLNIQGSDELLRGEASELSGFQIINDLEFTISLKQADSQFLYYLSMPYAGIFSHTAYLEDPYQWADKHLIGTGAYRYDGNASKENHIILKRFNAYHGMLPFLPRLDFLWYEDEEAILEAYRLGQLDIAPLPIYYYDKFKSLAGNHRIIQSEAQLPVTLFFNASDRLLQNRALRQAISHALDREAIHKRYPILFKEDSYNFLQKTMFGASMISLSASYDLQKAQALMQEAGYANGLRLVIHYHDADEYELWKIIQEQLLGINIHLMLLKQEASQWYADMQAGEHRMMIFSMEGLHPRGRDLFYRLFHSSQSPRWSINYSDPRFDYWIDMMRMSENSHEVSRMNHDLEELLISQEAMMIPLTFLPKYYIMRSDLQYQPSFRRYNLFNFSHYSIHH